MFYNEDDRAQRLFDVFDVIDGQINVSDVILAVNTIIGITEEEVSVKTCQKLAILSKHEIFTNFCTFACFVVCHFR